jgi:hypothetical protein
MFDNRRGKLARFLASDPGAFGSSMLSAYLAEAWVTLRDNSCAHLLVGREYRQGFLGKLFELRAVSGALLGLKQHRCLL